MKLHTIGLALLLLLCVAAVATQDDESNPVSRIRSHSQRSQLEDDSSLQGKVKGGVLLFFKSC